jgi:hypothetical protein
MEVSTRNNAALAAHGGCDQEDTELSPEGGEKVGCTDGRVFCAQKPMHVEQSQQRDNRR